MFAFMLRSTESFIVIVLSLQLLFDKRKKIVFTQSDFIDADNVVILLIVIVISSSYSSISSRHYRRYY